MSAQEQDRPRFEAWLQSFDGCADLAFADGDYEDFDTQRAWAAWKAATVAPSAVERTPEELSRALAEKLSPSPTASSDVPYFSGEFRPLIDAMNEALMDTYASGRPAAHLEDAWENLQLALSRRLPSTEERGEPSAITDLPTANGVIDYLRGYVRELQEKLKGRGGYAVAAVSPSSTEMLTQEQFMMALRDLGEKMAADGMPAVKHLLDKGDGGMEQCRFQNWAPHLQREAYEKIGVEPPVRMYRRKV